MFLQTTESGSPGAGPGIVFLPAHSYPPQQYLSLTPLVENLYSNYPIDLEFEELVDWGKTAGGAD